MSLPPETCAFPSIVFSMVMDGVGAKKGVDLDSMKYSTMPAPNSSGVPADGRPTHSQQLSQWNP